MFLICADGLVVDVDEANLECSDKTLCSEASINDIGPLFYTQKGSTKIRVIDSYISIYIYI